MKTTKSINIFFGGVQYFNFTEKDYIRFKSLYADAIRSKRKSFMFEDNIEVLVCYAKYVIELLDAHFK